MTSAFRVRRVLACAALAHVAAGSPAAWAQDVAERVILGRIVVTGARNTERDRGLLGEPILPSDAPVDIRSIPSEALFAPGNTSLASILSRDASVEENYATTGYYQNFMIRGFKLDLGSAYRINGFVVPAEFDIPLDNMESVQLLKGVAGVHGGMIAAGGTINFLTRRPGHPNWLRTDLESRGGRLVSLETEAGSTHRDGVALRMNATHADMHPEQPMANGSRDLLSLAVDAKVAPNVLLQADLIAQRRSQPAVPGFQLLGGTNLPDLSSVRDLNINRQPWSRPVTNRGAMGDVHVDWQVSDSLWVRGGIAETVALIDDNLATPSGCNSSPVQYFCSNGDYVLYNYHASERRAGGHITGSLHALTHTGQVAHAVTVGVDRIDRTIQQNNLYSATTLDAAGNALTGNLRSTAVALPQPGGIGADQPRVKATQTAAFISDQATLGQVVLLAGVRFVQIAQQPADSQDRRSLPQLAVTWHVQPGYIVYASAADGLEFGSQAPLTAANAGVLLSPRSTRQFEIGWKGQDAAGSRLAIAAFTMRRPYEFTLPVGSSYAGLGDYVRGGMQTNSGISIDAQSSPAYALRLEGSLAFLIARASGSGLPSYDGVQVQNVPRLGGFVQATYALPKMSVEFYVSSTQRSRRNARADGLASVPGYAIFDAGADWHGTVSGKSVIVALRVSNLSDRRYWRDAGEAYSANLLFPGASRSVAVSARLEF